MNNTIIVASNLDERKTGFSNSLSCLATRNSPRGVPVLPRSLIGGISGPETQSLKCALTLDFLAQQISKTHRRVSCIASRPIKTPFTCLAIENDAGKKL